MTHAARWVVSIGATTVALSLFASPAGAAGRFGDDDGSEFEEAIETVAVLGVTRGCDPDDLTRYCPQDPVTRGQMAAFLRRALRLPAGRADHFVDDDGNIFEGDIDALATAGITLGCTVDEFCPFPSVTRGQMAAFLVRAFRLEGGAGSNRFTDDDGSEFETEIDKLATAGITLGCAQDRFCPLDPVTRGQMAAFLIRALHLETYALVAAGDDVQVAVDRHPAGTTFLLGSGVHHGQQVIPDDGQTFIGAEGAVLDGDDDTSYAFWGSASNVTIRNLVIEDYAPALQEAPIFPLELPGPCSEGWLVQGNEVRNNATGGIHTCHRIDVIGNYVHHNGQWGISGSGDGVIVENNEVSYNNPTNMDVGEQGGGKFQGTDGLVVRNNYVHHNKGPGFHTDGDNIDTLYEDNLFVANTWPGIQHEISYDAVIRNNRVVGNGFGAEGGLDGAGIMVFASPDVEVYGNEVIGNKHGIVGKHDERESGGSHGPYELRDLWVHDNLIRMPTGATGVVDYSEGTPSYGWNNDFDSNTYLVRSTGGEHWWWLNEGQTWTAWHNFGQDQNGTVSAID